MIKLTNITAGMGGFSLGPLSLEIGKGEYFVVLGPSGAGKTVLLEIMAGLRRPKSGEVWINGTDATQLSPEKRKVGYVPQDYVLFPFLNVYDNIAFGLREVNCPGLPVDENLRRMAQLLGISHLLARSVRTLSGGEKQRISLARALVLAPKVLLLDEPLSNLDLKTARYLRVELKRVHHELGVTVVHVTHNQSEAEELADRIGVLNLGRMEQVGKPAEVFFFPENEVVSDLIGTPNILSCDGYRPLGQGLVEADCGGLHITLPYDDGEPVRRLALFPRDVYISDGPPPGPSLNRFRGVLKEIKPMGGTVRLGVQVDGHTLYAEMPVDIFSDMNLTTGQEVYLILKLKGIKIY